MTFSQAQSRGRLLRFLVDNLGQEVTSGSAAGAGSFIAINANDELILSTAAAQSGDVFTPIDASNAYSTSSINIGSDATPTNALDVVGTVGITSGLYVADAGIIHTGDTDTTITFGANTQIYTCAASERLKMNSTGVGLMGATPIAGLAVTGDIDASGDLTAVNLNVATDIIHVGDTDTKITFGANTQIYTCDTKERLKMNSTGVGLMGATPIEGLAVTGDIGASGDLTVGGTNNGTGVRAEFLADAASVTNFGAYWETCGAHNVTADNVLKAVNSNNGQLYDMLGPATTTSNIYWYSCTATGAGGTATTERATDGLGANPFTGQHPCEPVDPEIAENRQDYVGLIVCSTGEFKRFDRCAQEWKTSKEGITINEALPRVALSSTSNDKSVFGVVSNRPNVYVQNPDTGEWEDDEDGVAIGFRDILSNQVRVNSLGEGAIWICNISGNLENGDYITTCEIPGLGMKQDDDRLHNYTVAKITQDCDFRINASNYNVVEFEFSGSTYRKAFVGCTYHCG